MRDENSESADSRESGETASSGKILIIEDNLDSRDLLCKLLKLSGYRVSTASDGESGYAAAVAGAPDLIITDINMPKIDGIEFVKRVRFDRVLGKVPIMVVTAYGPSVTHDAQEAGADATLDKPFDFDNFLHTVRSLLAPRRLRQAAQQPTNIP
ncbi:MAG TPA: response regulator [Blastocatellia bacterium]|nr:response regulator [Blastocatellia bacterium]